MIPAAFVPLVSHIWQSTLFAAIAGLLALAFRRNQARVRYWLWVAASYKFLLPFSWLVSIGHQFEWRTAPAIMPHAFSAVTDMVAGPIFLTALPAVKPTPDYLPALLLVIWAVWACGFVAVAVSWTREWLRIRAIVRAASPLSLGLPICVVSTPARLEPGVFGIFRPVLLLPEGITGRLTQPQLQGILAHELCHVRRRDNLTAMIHMLVEATFWFYPLPWWLGARLIDERECACDEEVLQTGSQAQAYAESILRVCEFYLESPLTCMSGVTGSDLKKRIRRIMKEHFGVALSGRKKCLLATAAVAAVAVPLVVGALTAPRLGAQSSAGQSQSAAERPSFDVASIKANKSGAMRVAMMPQPGGRFLASNVTLSMLLRTAYQLKGPEQMSGAPDWSDSEHFDIEAKAAGNPTREQNSLMMQSLLADRFKLVVHRETRQLPVYALVLSKAGKTGPAFLPHLDDTKCADPSGPPPPPPAQGAALPAFCGGFFNMMNFGTMRLAGNKVTMEMLVAQLSNSVDRVVVDRTGLSGTFDVSLEYTSQQAGLSGFPPGAGPGPGTGATPADPSPSAPPSLPTALQEQLGLKLVPQTGPVEVLVIDHVERPSEN